jgi:serine/threonine protein phosphatase PrpC
MIKFSTAALTDVGAKRNNNEDAFCIREDLGLFIVADGMGGHMSGEIASRLAVEGMVDFIERLSRENESTWPYPYDDTLSYGENKLKMAILMANERIQAYASEHPESKGMGTTVVAVYEEDGSLILANVGDSRAYLFRNGDLKILTSDHSWVNEQVRQGFLSETEAAHHPFRNVITRALGTKEEVLPDLTRLEPENGDLLLLCTDGLNTMVENEELKTIFREVYDPKELCRKFVDQANDNGGEDNVTVLLLRKNP